jgi:hypothetical protein
MGSNPDKVTGFFNSPNPSSCTVALGSTELLTEMSTRNLPEGKGRPSRKADSLNWETRRLITLWVFTACYRDSFAFFLLHFYVPNLLFNLPE